MATPPDPCPLCGRPNYFPSDHHLVPKCRGGRQTETICQDCHSAIHALFSNKQLESEFSTVEALMADERFRRTVRFLSKQDPTRRMKTDRANDQRRRGRNG